MVKLSYQSAGQSWSVGIAGEPKEIEEQYYSFYNHGATDETEPMSISDRFVYFRTTPQKLFNALRKAELFKILNSKELNGWKAKNMAKERATKRFKDIASEQFLPQNGIISFTFSVAKPEIH